MPDLVLPAPAPPTVAVAGSAARFAVRRIYCVGRNYASHAREMGGEPSREPPFFFMKPADAVVDDGAVIPYPPLTANLHHEVELVVALGAGGAEVAAARATDLVWGYGIGLDLTRRDLQFLARDSGRPWEWGKAFDRSAPCGPLHPASSVGHLARGRIWLSVGGSLRQDADLSELIWTVPEVIATISRSVTLAAGDLIFTGTPAGVGALTPGDRVTAGIAGLGELQVTIGPRAA